MRATPGLQPFIATYCTSHSRPNPILRHQSRALTQENLNAQTPAFKTSINRADLPDQSLTIIDHAAMEFFSSVMLWFDIIGAASSGTRPQYSDICAAALGDLDSKVRLENIMGCENWVMIAIREISLLDDWRTRTDEGRSLNADEFAGKMKPLEKKLQAGILKSFHLSRTQNGSNNISTRENVIHRITHVFACGARVYLNSVLLKPDLDCSIMRGAVADTLDALYALPDPIYLRSTVWPFCISGCMADKEQQKSFKDLAFWAGINKSISGSSRRAVEIMEACWAMDASSSIDRKKAGWVHAMESLGYHVLLV
jgi:C6 transcription factor Pro1